MDILLRGKRQCDYGADPMQKLAIYDMDKTITRKATFGPFLAYAVPRYAPWRIVMLPLVALVTLGYVLKLLDRGRLKDINLGLMMGRRIDSARLATIARGFAGQTLARNMLPRGLDRIAADKAEGYQVMIASASYAFYVEEVAKLVGADAVVATLATDVGQSVSPKLAGENCYGAAKLAMVQANLAARSIDRSQCHVRFYSDHVSDAPCLEWADEAFATNPHPSLRALAQAKGWTIFDWMQA